MIHLQIYGNARKIWWKDGLCHRLNGPAVVFLTGYRAWWYRGLLHRTDGPARIFEDGQVEYWINDKHVTEYVVMFLNGIMYD